MRTMYKILSIKAGILLSVFALLFATAGCTDDDQAASVSATAEEILINNTATTVPVTIRATTSWTAKSDQEWCYISQENGKGTTEVFIMAGELTSDLKRSANITITPAAGQPWTIKVTQLPAKDTGVSVAPGMITVNAAASTGNSFTVKVQHAAAVITATTTSPWIKNLVPAGNSTGQKSYLYTFNVDEYTGAAEREATITVTVRFGQHVYTETVTVIQNGLGAPAISTPANVYLNHNAVSHEQNIWVEGGNQANVTYALYITANESGSDPLPEPTPIADDVTVSNGTNPAISESWIKSAEIVDGVLTVVTNANNFDETREGDILIVAFRDNMTTKLNVHVSQAGHRTPGIDLKLPVVSHNSEMAEGAIFMLNPVNNSVVTHVGNTPAWLTNVEVADDFMSFTYDVDSYDGFDGDFREASVILKADNGHTNPAYYTVTVRQYAPLAPAIGELPQYIGISALGTLGQISIPLNLLNGTTAAMVSIDPLTPAWIGATINNGVLSYNVAAYTGTVASFWREGVITIVADKGNGNKAYYYVTVRQYGDQFASLNPSSLAIQSSSVIRTDYNMVLQSAISGSYISAVNTTGLTNAGWGFVGGCTNNPTLLESFLIASSFQPTSLNLTLGAVTLGDVTAGHGIQRWGVVYVTIVNGLYSQIITLPVSQTIVNPTLP